MGLCRAWLSAGPVAWQAVLGAARGEDVGLEIVLVLAARDGDWTKATTKGLLLDSEEWVWKRGRGMETYLLTALPVSQSTRWQGWHQL